jgi:hypothetical protein
MAVDHGEGEVEFCRSFVNWQWLGDDRRDRQHAATDWLRAAWQACMSRGQTVHANGRWTPVVLLHVNKFNDMGLASSLLCNY